MKTYIYAIVGILVGLVIGYFVFHSTSSKPIVGGSILAENYDPYILTARGYFSNFPIAVGISNGGNALNPIISGTCNLVGGAIAGFTTVQSSCTVPGFVASTTGIDQITVELASSTTPVIQIGASASTTATGIITVSLYNSTSTPSSVTAVGTSTDYLIIN